MKIGRLGLLLLLAGLVLCGQALADPTLSAAVGEHNGETLTVMCMGTGPAAPMDTSDSIVTVVPQSVTTLSNVPRSTWTYGCSATSAGMMFGYYDRTGMSNMYAGPKNGGVAPVTNLGQGVTASPTFGCSIIATQNGFDGRTTRGHVDDYWISTNSTGPDPWVTNGWTEHTWADCTADYMGTNQWKWDFIGGDSVIDFNKDGSTALFSYSSATKLHDYIPAASAGLPQTALCHGLKLFAQSRGYGVVQNYTQKIDTVYAGGFSINDFKNEIDAGRPVMVQIHGHSMCGVGYDIATNTIYFHDTWDNNLHSMVWGTSYGGMSHEASTVLQLAVPSASVTSAVNFGDVIVGATVGNQNINVAESGGQSRLDYALGSSPSGYTVAGAGSSHFVSAGGNQNHAVSLNTSTVANLNGSSVTVSDTAVTPGTLATVTANARVLDHASPSAGGPVNLGTVILGAPDQTGTSTYANLARGDGLRADLEVTAMTGLPAGIVSVGGMNVGDKLAQGTSKTLTFTGKATTVGNHCTLTVQGSDDTALPGATAVANQTITVNFTVLDHSEASFIGAGNQDTFTIDFGTVTQGAGVGPSGFSLFNLDVTQGLTADLKLDTITPAGNSTVLTTNLAKFSNLAAGSSNGYQASFDTSNVGTFNATYTLGVSDENLPGATAGTNLVLTLIGRVVPAGGVPIPEPSALWMLGLAGLGLRRRRRG